MNKSCDQHTWLINLLLLTDAFGISERIAIEMLVKREVLEVTEEAVVV
jgi:hypothetical protein